MPSCSGKVIARQEILLAPPMIHNNRPELGPYVLRTAWLFLYIHKKCLDYNVGHAETGGHLNQVHQVQRHRAKKKLKKSAR